MREIKFRAWDKVEKKMGEVRILDFVCQMVQVKSGKFFDMWGFENIELLQFTGTYDDDKSEIWQGDILFSVTEDGFCLYLVKTESIFSGFYLAPVKHVDFSYEEKYQDENNSETIEFVKKYNPEHKSFFIIGNIYENPELMEVE